MTKGTTSRGQMTGGKAHTTCRRCGKVAFHMQKAICASCGYPNAKMRQYNWGEKAIGRRTQGTGRLRHIKRTQRAARNGFREGKTMKKASSQ